MGKPNQGKGPVTALSLRCTCTIFLQINVLSPLWHTVLTFSQDNINVDEAARFLVENILANDKGLPYEESNGDRIKLDQETVAAESKSGCCWHLHWPSTSLLQGPTRLWLSAVYCSPSEEYTFLGSSKLQDLLLPALMPIWLHCSFPYVRIEAHFYLDVVANVVTASTRLFVPHL